MKPIRVTVTGWLGSAFLACTPTRQGCRLNARDLLAFYSSLILRSCWGLYILGMAPHQDVNASSLSPILFGPPRIVRKPPTLPFILPEVCHHSHCPLAKPSNSHAQLLSVRLPGKISIVHQFHVPCPCPCTGRKITNFHTLMPNS